MMKRETLNGYRWATRKYGHYPSIQREQTLIDSHLEALDRIEELERKINDHLLLERK